MRRKPILLLCAGLLFSFLFPLTGKGQQGASPFFNERYDFYQGSEVGISIIPRDSGYFALIAEKYASDITGGGSVCRVALLDYEGKVDSVHTYYADSTSTFGTVFSRGALIEDKDGNFLFPGSYRDSSTTWSPDLNLMKFASSGDTIWTRHFGAANKEEYPIDVCHAPGGDGYFLLGTRYSGGDFTLLLYKLDTAGNLLWQKSYGGSGSSYPRSVDTTSDGGVVIAGYSNSFFSDSKEKSFVLKLDSTGNQEWVRGFENPDADSNYQEGVARALTTQDGHIAFATPLTDSLIPQTPVPYNHIAVGKLDVNGDTVWYKEFARTVLQYGIASLREFPNGDLLLVGRNDSYLDSTYTRRARGWMMRLSPQGDSLWEREYTMPDSAGGGKTTHYYFYGGRPESDSSILATGFSQYNDTGNHQDLWTIKTNCAGFTDYPSADFSFTTDSSKGVSFTNESANAMDYFWSFGDGYHSSLKEPDYTYLDTNSYTVQLIASACGVSDTITKTVQPEEVEDTTSVEEFDEEEVSFQVHPNPNEGRFQVRYEIPSPGGRIELRDMQGRPALEQRLPSRKGNIPVDRTELSPGIYLLQLRSEEGRTLGRRKMVVR